MSLEEYPDIKTTTTWVCCICGAQMVPADATGGERLAFLEGSKLVPPNGDKPWMVGAQVLLPEGRKGTVVQNTVFCNEQGHRHWRRIGIRSAAGTYSAWGISAGECMEDKGVFPC